MGNNLNTEVEKVLASYKHLKRQERNLERRREFLDKEEKKLMRETSLLTERIRKGERLSDSLLNYAFDCYRERAKEVEPDIKRFMSLIKRYRGQRILSDENGFTAYTTAIGIGPTRQERKILTGVLVPPVYDFTKNLSLVAVVRDLRVFDANESAKWECYTDGIIQLDKFLKEYIEGNQLFSHFVLPDATKEGDIMRIHVPEKEEQRIGGSIEYDSDIIATLVLGSEKVENYLKGLKFEARKKFCPGFPE